MTADYRGRFAPSPTGPLHFGSLVAAVASYLDARANHGAWLVRIEDVDETRTVAGAADDILHTLEGMGFAWDGEVRYQSQRKQRYQDAIAGLLTTGIAYPCACSRSEIARVAKQGAEGYIYPGTCRNGLPPGKQGHSIRLRTQAGPIQYQDRVLGAQSQDIESEVGDFVIRRTDGFTAYQLAVVLDDADQQITQVVRGADLLSSTPRQIYLQRLLGLETPGYAHIPLVLDQQGNKLSKQDAAHPVSLNCPLTSLLDAWRFLSQAPLPERPAGLEDFWTWAIPNWKLENLIHHDQTNPL